MEGCKILGRMEDWKVREDGGLKIRWKIGESGEMEN